MAKKKIGRSFRHETRSKVNSSVEYKSSDLEIDVDVVAIAKTLGDVGVAAVRSGIRSITKPTQDGTHKQFTETGTLVNGLTSRATGTGTGDSEVVAPPNRLQDDAVFARMVELVPVLADPLQDEAIDAAIEKITREVVRAG